MKRQSPVRPWVELREAQRPLLPPQSQREQPRPPSFDQAVPIIPDIPVLTVEFIIRIELEMPISEVREKQLRYARQL